MLLDKKNMIMDAVLLSAIPAGATTAAGTTPVAGVIDLLGGGTAQSDNYGIALTDITPYIQDIETFAIIAVAAAAGGTSLNVQLVTGSTITPTTVVAQSGVIATAGLTLGLRLPLEIPRGTKLGRYLGIQLVHVGTAFTGTGELHISFVPRDGQQTAQA
jgi:hypothetical protein